MAYVGSVGDVDAIGGLEMLLANVWQLVFTGDLLTMVTVDRGVIKRRVWGYNRMQWMRSDETGADNCQRAEWKGRRCCGYGKREVFSSGRVECAKY
jgi:hypothetical protein